MTLRCATTSSAIARLPLSKLLAVFLFGLSFAIQPNEGWAVPTSAKLQVYQCPKWLNVSPFYVKYVDANGLPILGSVRVSNLALIRAGVIVIEMLSARPDIMSALKRAHVRVAVMASTEKTLDIPEHSDLQIVFPKTNWNTRARGVGSTEARPVCSCAEENLLQLRSDPYLGENILVHEFGHTILNMAVEKMQPDFRTRLVKAYSNAIAAGKWKNTDAASNVDEYWAEGVQDWFDVNLTSVPANGIHNEIHLRAQLQQYDPELAALIAEVFGQGKLLVAK